MITNKEKLMKDFESDLQDRLKAIHFPNEEIEPDFRVAIVPTLLCHSAMGAKCDFETYEALIRESDASTISEWNFWTISFMLNMMEASKPRELGMRMLEDYLQLVRATRKMATYWNSVVEPIRAELMEKHTPKQPTGPRLIPSSNKKRNGSRG